MNEKQSDLCSADDPLLIKHDESHNKVNSTVTSMDSALSNSDNCSEIELEHIKYNNS